MNRTELLKDAFAQIGRYIGYFEDSFDPVQEDAKIDPVFALAALTEYAAGSLPDGFAEAAAELAGTDREYAAERIGFYGKILTGETEVRTDCDPELDLSLVRDKKMLPVYRVLYTIGNIIINPDLIADHSNTPLMLMDSEELYIFYQKTLRPINGLLAGYLEKQ